MQINPIMKVDCLASDASCPVTQWSRLRTDRQTVGPTGRTGPARNAALNINARAVINRYQLAASHLPHRDDTDGY